MNRLKVWMYTVLVAVVGAAALFGLSRGLTRGTQAETDRQVSACASQADARLQLLLEHAGRVAERMARDPALSQALTAEASEGDLSKALAAAERGDPGEAAGLTVAAVGSRGPARFARTSATELEPLLTVAREGRRVEAYLLTHGALHQAVAMPVGLGAAVAVAVPASVAWLRQARAATSCELTVVASGKSVESTLPPAQAALVVRAARAGIGTALGAGALSAQALTLPWKLPIPPLPLLFAEASAHRVSALALEGVPAGALVLSQDMSGPMSSIVTYGWVGLAGLVLLFLVGFVLGFFVTEGQQVAFPKELLIAADRVGRGDFSARAPVLAGRLGTIAGALNRAAEAAWTPPAPVPPGDTGSAPLTDAISRSPAAAPANPFTAGSAEPASWAVQRDVASAESVPPMAEPRTAEAPTGERESSDAAPGEPVAARDGETAAPANAWLESPSTAPRDGGAAAPAAAPQPPRDKTSPDFFGVPPAEPTGHALGDDDEEHWKTVYQDFLRVRTDCGESPAGVTYERFREKLHKNRDQLAERYGCRTVRFQVYVKEGKAALKASPVR